MTKIEKEINRAINSHIVKANKAIDAFYNDALSGIKFNHHISAAYHQQIARCLSDILLSKKLTKDDFLQRVEIYKSRLSNTIRTQEDIIMHSVIVEMISLMETYAEINH